MTLDLDELERKAKAAIGVPHVTLGKDDALVIRDGPVAEFAREATPTVVLALIDRVREMERRINDSDGIADAFVDGSGEVIYEVTANAQVAAGLRKVRDFMRGET